MTMDQAVYVTPITQGALFGFPPYGERGGQYWQSAGQKVNEKPASQ